MDIAILITCFNRKDITLKCLNHLFDQKINFDVFLVDDGSIDGTYEAVKMFYPSINIIVGDGNLFWNRGMHLAWKSALDVKEFDYYIWLNDDTLLFDSSLSFLINTSSQYSDQAIVIGTTCSSYDVKNVTYGGRLTNGEIVIPDGVSTTLCAYFNGNIVLIPRFVYERVGMNDPVFHHSLGDFDYGLRAKRNHIPLAVASEILGSCNAHDSLPTWCNPNKPLLTRWRTFRTPLGNNPEEHFVFEYRHRGLFVAIFHYFTNHLRVVFPKIWQFRKK